jgi:hypothetical protein
MWMLFFWGGTTEGLTLHHGAEHTKVSRLQDYPTPRPGDTKTGQQHDPRSKHDIHIHIQDHIFLVRVNTSAVTDLWENIAPLLLL